MRGRVFYSTCFGCAFGVLLASFVSLNPYIVILVGALSLSLFLIFLIGTKWRWGIAGSLFFLLCALGALRFQAVPQSAPGAFENQLGEKASFAGEVVDEPTFRENNIALDVEIENGDDKTQVLITTSLGQDFKYGDKIAFEGELEEPENFIGDQGKEFDYIDYLKKDGIFYVMSYPDIERISRGNGNKIKSALFAAKDAFVDRINFAIPAPESLLMGGLILGEKSSFDKALRQSFVNTGTIHIVALSGYNVSIVAEWFMKLFAFLPRLVGIGAGVFAIALFIVMTGASSTAIRAGIMATLALVARATGRTYDIGRALVLAGVLMILANPMLLAYDVSFQLSFLATVAVVFLSPKIEKYFLWVTPRFGLRDIVSVTVAAYLFVLPFILYEMGNLSLVALPANILVLPFVPVTMVLGFITGFAGIVWQVLALPFGFISYAFLKYELGVIGILSRIPFAALSIKHFPLWATLLIYACLSSFMFGRSVRRFFDNQSHVPL